MRPPRIMLRNLVDLSLGEANGSTSSLLGPSVTALHASMTFAMLTITYGAGASLGVITPVLQVMDISTPSIPSLPLWILTCPSAIHVRTRQCSWCRQSNPHGCAPSYVFVAASSRTRGIRCWAMWVPPKHPEHAVRGLHLTLGPL